jgi:predicted transposase/invertase (TIGR01784 family)
VKYVDENTPEIYREWLSAINESLSEQIDETNYHRPELQTVINSIAKNLVSPEEKYWMIEEYNFENDKKKKFDEGIQQGIQQGLQQGIQQGEKDKALTIAKGMLAKGIDIQTISELTGLTNIEIETNNEIS